MFTQHPLKKAKQNSQEGETELDMRVAHSQLIWIIRQGASPVKQACAIDHGIAGRYHLKRVEEYDGMIAQWMLRHTQAEFMEQLNKFDALATPVNDIETLLADPHVRDRGTVVTRTFG